MDNHVFIGAIIFLCVFAACMTMCCRKKSSSESFETEAGFKRPELTREMRENVVGSGLLRKNNTCEDGCSSQCVIDCKDVSNYELCYALCTETCDGSCAVDVHYPPK